MVRSKLHFALIAALAAAPLAHAAPTEMKEAPVAAAPSAKALGGAEFAIATAAGVLFALNPLLGAATLATWLIIAVFFRYSSLAALVSAVFAPFYQLLFWDFDAAVPSIIAMSLLLVWRHSANIGKLLAGTESRIGGKAQTPAQHPAPAQRHAGHGHSHDAAHAERKRARQHKGEVKS